MNMGMGMGSFGGIWLLHLGVLAIIDVKLFKTPPAEGEKSTGMVPNDTLPAKDSELAGHRPRFDKGLAFPGPTPHVVIAQPIVDTAGRGALGTAWPQAEIDTVGGTQFSRFG